MRWLAGENFTTISCIMWQWKAFVATLIAWTSPSSWLRCTFNIVSTPLHHLCDWNTC
ncbi:hypothetical protein M378DRAFT_796556 [Amanita muscaria Koide BX008]|uniref:Uncharacterized protein n=1 Tax=Amanita muscaria (strain Koide BX008) TaxID=946122 RepID=A0A0C2SGW9_AMAMK|nr:hypothetical protein M378DRAFT_796556 [Amanita muscaria Koide BX008]